MHRVSEVIIVEGRYDKNALMQTVDAVVIETGGFAVFNDGEKQSLIRKMAQKHGLIVLTDSDGAGFVIRNFIKGCVDPKYVKHAYIPEIYGRERRKTRSSKEGLLGVEGMSPELILEALRRCGATIDDSEAPAPAKISKADMFAAGLSGGPDSAKRRSDLKKKLGLPDKLSSDSLLQVLNALMSREEFLKMQNFQ